ncbi:MAG TPA: hypothetical protein PKY59_04725 [Pyrinomonadaceae bacterium]|nr:hypothetical protein [Pyrinomonadaceae bacterium]
MQPNVFRLIAEPNQLFAEVSEELIGFGEEFARISETISGISEEFTGISEEFIGISELFIGFNECFAGVSELFILFVYKTALLFLYFILRSSLSPCS